MPTPARPHRLGLRVSHTTAVMAAVVVLIGGAPAIHAQERAVIPLPGEPAPPTSDLPRRATGAFLGAFAGAFAGVMLAGPIAGIPDWSLDNLYGAVVGSAALAPIGAHLFDDDPGSLLPPVMATAAFTALILARDEGPTELLVVLPIGQILTSALFGRGPG